MRPTPKGHIQDAIGGVTHHLQVVIAQHMTEERLKAGQLGVTGYEKWCAGQASQVQASCGYDCTVSQALAHGWGHA